MTSREITPRFIPDLIDVEQELFELPRKVRQPTTRQNGYSSGL